MKYRAWIINNKTGEGRWYEDTSDLDVLRFWWEEGNASCDCNRALFWCRAGSEKEIDVECGDEKFDVPFLEIDGGLRVAIQRA